MVILESPSIRQLSPTNGMAGCPGSTSIVPSARLCTRSSRAIFLGPSMSGDGLVDDSLGLVLGDGQSERRANQ